MSRLEDADGIRINLKKKTWAPLPRIADTTLNVGMEVYYYVFILHVSDIPPYPLSVGLA